MIKLLQQPGNSCLGVKDIKGIEGVRGIRYRWSVIGGR